MIASGLIEVNSQIIQPGHKLIKGDSINLDGKTIVFNEEDETQKIIVALNKPAGVVCTLEAKEKQNIINFIHIYPENFIGSAEDYDHIKNTRLFPIGRLDKDSRGLILLTNDGDLAFELSHPSNNKEKEYLVNCYEPISDRDLAELADGVFIETDEGNRVKTRTTSVSRVDKRTFRIILKQGYKRQIRQMVAAISNEVEDLQRIRIDNLALIQYKNFQNISADNYDANIIIIEDLDEAYFKKLDAKLFSNRIKQ